MANSAKEFIDVIPPSDLKRSVITQIAQPEEDGSVSSGLDSLKIYLSPNQGSIILHVRPEELSTNYVRRGGRRYLFCTDTGFACWLSEKHWKYQVGHCDASVPFFTFPKLAKEAPILLGMSYAKRYMCFGIGEGHTGDKVFQLEERFHLPYTGIITSGISLLSRHGGSDSFYGYWHGISTTANHVGLNGLQYALENYRHFLPHDIQRFPLEDAVFKANIVVARYERPILLDLET